MLQGFTEKARGFVISSTVFDSPEEADDKIPKPTSEAT